MNKCLTHNQEYPVTSWCVYCGVPGVQITSPVYTGGTARRCPSCGLYDYWGSHYCYTWSTPIVHYS